MVAAAGGGGGGYFPSRSVSTVKLAPKVMEVISSGRKAMVPHTLLFHLKTHHSGTYLKRYDLHLWDMDWI